MLNFIATKIFGTVNERTLKEVVKQVAVINSFEKKMQGFSDADLQNQTAKFRLMLSSGSTLDSILPEAFATVREVSSRVLKMRHFDVQLVGGIVLHQGKIAEMKTGEGKTLMSTLACYLNALGGKGVHIVTVNDYLAKRDSEQMGRIYNFLGLSVGCITDTVDHLARIDAYNCDITYATNNELGFDYLRDQIRDHSQKNTQRKLSFAIIDEVDSILIDEARTPLIISGPTNDNSDLYLKINKIIANLKEEDYTTDLKDRNCFFTDIGIEKLEKYLITQGVCSYNSSIYDAENTIVLHHLNQSLKAHKLFKKEVDYIVKNNAVIIIDEFTGRMQEGRRFSDGLHQALEAKEKVRIQNENQTLATITFQNYFRLYDKISGMTGTASTEAQEFEEIYNLKVVEIPTNLPINRLDCEDQIYKTEVAKTQAVVDAVKEAHQRKQPVLIGTVSIEKSEEIATILKKNKLPYNILNAKFHEKEAEIIAQAGSPSTITIATNMAGRGTDIVLGGNFSKQIANITDHSELMKIETEAKANRDIVVEAGGLLVIGTERHESRRIDNQLRGRSGRQGDPGKSIFFISLQDDLMKIFGSDKLSSMLSRLGLADDEAITHPWITKTLEKAQQKVENRNYETRKNLLKYDDITNEQRKYISNLRQEAVKDLTVITRIKEASEDVNNKIIADSTIENQPVSEDSLDRVSAEFHRIYNCKLPIDAESINSIGDSRHLLAIIDKESQIVIDNKINSYDSFKVVGNDLGDENPIAEPNLVNQIAIDIFFSNLDFEWKEHLLNLDKLRSAINLRAYAQKDPLIEYKRESFDLFEDMIVRIDQKTLINFCHIKLHK